MDTGEKEQRLAFEEVTRRNVNSMIQFSNETRDLVRTLEQNIINLQNIIMNRDNDITLLKQQLAMIQTMLFSGGTSLEDNN